MPGLKGGPARAPCGAQRRSRALSPENRQFSEQDGGRSHEIVGAGVPAPVFLPQSRASIERTCRSGSQDRVLSDASLPQGQARAKRGARRMLDRRTASAVKPRRSPRVTARKTRRASDFAIVNVGGAGDLAVDCKDGARWRFAFRSGARPTSPRRPRGATLLLQRGVTPTGTRQYSVDYPPSTSRRACASCRNRCVYFSSTRAQVLVANSAMR